MALNNSPNYPPIGDGPYLIDRQWCMGDSLPFINTNFDIFDNRILTLSSTFVKQISAGDNITVTPTLTSNIIRISNTIPPAILQVQYALNPNAPTTSSSAGAPNSKPTTTNGIEILTKNITPRLNNSFIKIYVNAHVSNTSGGAIIALFKDSDSNALATSTIATNPTIANNITLTCIDTVTSLTEVSYKVRLYTNGSGNVALNRENFSNSRGSTFKSYLTLEEFRS